MKLGSFSDYIELIKLRITVMQLVTVFLGYVLGASQGNGLQLVRMTWLLIATFCVASGVAALNHYLERSADKKMKRTENRPLPQNRINPNLAFIFGLMMSVLGIILAMLKVNPITGFICAMTAGLYVFVYTPLKRMTWVNTLVGAIPGALPPLGGWVAATETLSAGGWLLFLLLFAWQHPHFYAIAWLYKDDYDRAGFQMLPSVDQSGINMKSQIMLFSILTLGAPIQLYRLSIIHEWTVLIGTLLGLYYLYAGFTMCRDVSPKTAKHLLLASIIYLPLLVCAVLIEAFLI